MSKTENLPTRNALILRLLRRKKTNTVHRLTASHRNCRNNIAVPKTLRRRVSCDRFAKSQVDVASKYRKRQPEKKVIIINGPCRWCRTAGNTWRGGRKICLRKAKCLHSAISRKPTTAPENHSKNVKFTRKESRSLENFTASTITQLEAMKWRKGIKKTNCSGWKLQWGCCSPDGW